jgi:hypothetical protein
MSKNNYDVIVFLGPTLSIEAAKTILPDAIYFPPVRCGDILFAMRLKPKLIAIIDGYFEHTGSVWHKEILFAMSQNITVVGASSMGALRAAELTDFGMIGIGSIFQDYYSGILTDDDEVAVLHQPQEFSYTPLSDAMVNIRATVAAACEQKIIDSAAAAAILAHAKKTNYHQRKLSKALNACQFEPTLHQYLQQWFYDNYIDLKQRDALLLLTTIATHQLSKKPTPPIHQTTFFRTIHRYVMCQPFPFTQDFLPEKELWVLKMTTQLSDKFYFVQQIAYLLSFSYFYAVHYQLKPAASSHSFDHPLCSLPKDLFKKNYFFYNEAEKNNFITRINMIFTAIDQLRNAKVTHDPEYYFLNTLRLFGLYQQYKKINDGTEFSNNETKFGIIKTFATLWFFADQIIIQHRFTPTDEACVETAIEFRRQQQLFKSEEAREWLHLNEINEEGYQQFVFSLTRMKLALNHMNILKIQYNPSDIFWLYDAMLFMDH